MAGKPRQNGDARLAEALARGESVEQAAQLAGVSIRTAFRRLETDEFRQLVSVARSRLVRQVGGRLAIFGTSAVVTLAELLRDEDGRLRLGAAKAILEHLFHGVEVADLLDRLERVEGLLKHGAERNGTVGLDGSSEAGGETGNGEANDHAGGEPRTDEPASDPAGPDPGAATRRADAGPVADIGPVFLDN